MSSRFEQTIKAAILAGALTMTGCGGSGGGGGGDNPDGSPSPQTLSAAETIDAQTLELTFTDPVVLKDASGAAAKFTLKQGFRNWNKDLNVNAQEDWICSQPNSTTIYPLCLAYDSVSPSLCISSSPTTTIVSYQSCVGGYFDRSFDLVSLTAFRRYSAGARIGNVTDVEAVEDDATKLQLIVSEPLTDDDDGTAYIGSGRLRLTFTDGGRTITDQHGFRIAGFGPKAEEEGNVVFIHGNSPLVLEARAISSTTVELEFNEPLATTDAAVAASHFHVTNWDLYEPPASAISYNAFYNSIYFDSDSSIGIAGDDLSLTAEGMRATLTLTGPINAGWDDTYGLQLTYYAGADPDPAALRDGEGNVLEVYADRYFPGNLEKDYVD